MEICDRQNIDDPICWMNETDPRVLDLWIAWLVLESDDTKNTLQPAEKAFQQMAEKSFNLQGAQRLPTSAP